MRYHLLSYPLSRDTPCFGSNPPFELDLQRSMEKGDTCNTSAARFHNHTGTHIDCPSHFVQGGKTVTDYSASDFVFHAPAIIDCSKKEDELITAEDLRKHAASIAGKDLLLLRTGFHALRNREIYSRRNPGIHPGAVVYLRETFPGLRCVGIDSISISAFSSRELGREAHRKAFETSGFAGEPLLLIEDMDLARAARYRKIFVAPLFMAGADASPCTVIGETEG